VAGKAPIGTLLERAVATGIFPGAVAGWAIRHARSVAIDTVAAGRTGISGNATPTGPDTFYDLASLTKPLATTTLVLLARREGRLALDDPLGEHLSEVRGSWLADQPLERLLTHTSGLPAWVPLYAIAREPAEWVRSLAGVGPEAKPGTEVVYSCPGFLLLGAVLERVMGRTLAELFRERIAAPLGLENRIRYGPPGAHAEVAAASARPLAERTQLDVLGYTDRWPPPGNRPDDGNARFLGGAAGNAGLFGTVDAVLRLALEFMPGMPEIVLTDEEREIATFNHTAGLGQDRGLGWQLATTPGCSAGGRVSDSAFGHTGFTGTSVWVDPDRGIAMALLSNRNHPVFRAVDLHPVRRRFHALVVGGNG